MGIISLVLGILATIFGIFCIVLAAVANKKEKKGINTAGHVLSIIGTALCAILFIACVACTAALS